ncbi:MAG TPA: hypothetical protein VK932_26105 [Kofleriaceae bacterium]|nr:hypothetical protein [Kofleriaceae bacterium]
MSLVDRSWSEPRGVPVVPPAVAPTSTASMPVAPSLLAAGTAVHAATTDLDEADLEPIEEGDELHPGGGPALAAAVIAPAAPPPPRFFDIPVVRPRMWPVARPDAAPARSNHDATSIVAPLPRPRAHDPSEPRAVGITSQHAAQIRYRRTARRRLRIALVAGAVAGVALAGVAALLLAKGPDRQVAAPQQPQAARVAAPAKAPAAPAKAPRANAVAPKKIAAAPAAELAPLTTTRPVTTRPVAVKSIAARPMAARPVAAPAKKPAVGSKAALAASPRPAPAATKAVAPASKTSPKVAAKARPAAKQPAIAAPPPRKPAPSALAAKKPAGKVAPATSKVAPTAASKAGKPAVSTNKPAPARPAARR